MKQSQMFGMYIFSIETKIKKQMVKKNKSKSMLISVVIFFDFLISWLISNEFDKVDFITVQEEVLKGLKL